MDELAQKGDPACYPMPQAHLSGNPLDFSFSGLKTAAINQIHNAKYYVGKAEELMPKWAAEGLKTDVIFVDPPRKGLTKEFIDAAVKTGPKKVVYISCNPATLVRDMQLLMEAGYTTDLVSPVDMFPQTPHVESVTVLERTQID